MMTLKDITNNPENQRIFDMVLEEAARQWYDGLKDSPERADGEGFSDFFYEIFEQKEAEYKEQFSCENCMYFNTETWVCQNKQSPQYNHICDCDDTCMEQEQ